MFWIQTLLKDIRKWMEIDQTSNKTHFVQTGQCQAIKFLPSRTEAQESKHDLPSVLPVPRHDLD